MKRRSLGRSSQKATRRRVSEHLQSISDGVLWSVIFILVKEVLSYWKQDRGDIFDDGA